MRATTSPTGDTVGFDGLRAVVGAGEGVVGRFPGIVCVAQCRDPGPLRELLALCASAGGPDPGRALARQLAIWMSGSSAPGSELRFGTVAAAGEQLAVFLVGAVEARVDGIGGLTLSGAHAAIGTDRLFTRPRNPVVLSLDGGQIHAEPADVYDLQAGVVPGAGVVLHTGAFDRDEPDQGQDAGLSGHEWFDTADLASDAQPPWPPGVPEQRTGERNGVAHWPPVAADDPWGASAAADTQHEFGHEFEREAATAADPELGGAPFAAGDEYPLNGSNGGRHALLSSGDPAGSDAVATARGDVPDRDVPDRDVLDWNVPDWDTAGFSRAHDLRALDARTGDPPGDVVVEQDDDGAAAGIDLFAAPASADRPTADRLPTDTSADVSTDLAVDSFFAPAPSGPARVDSPRADPAVDSAADSVTAPADGVAGVPSTAHAASAAPTPVTGEPSADLFAAPPRADARPGTRMQPNARRPTPRPSARRAPADPQPDRRGSELGGSDRPELAHRTRDDRPPGPGGAAGAQGPSGAQATSTMPGVLFRSEGDTDGAAPLSETPVPDVRQAPEVVDPARSGARIRGYRCENGHLNDPRSPTCRECGATIDERAGGLVAGPRPPLGRLVFDDGVAHVVDCGYLVGRMPEVDDRVRAGELRPIVVEDRVGSVSRVHAEIRVSGWDVLVVDTGSRNGTYVSGPDEGAWTALPPRRSRRLLPGAQVRIGARTFVFESSSTVR
jgi:FHA domain